MKTLWKRYISPVLWVVIVLGFSMISKTSWSQVLPEYSAFQPDFSGGVQLGTQGLGVTANYNFLGAFNVRAGFNGIPGVNFQYNGRGAQWQRSSIFVMADWQPRYGNTDWLSRKWYISAGYAHYYSNSIYHQANQYIPAYTVTLSKNRPYIGTGLGNIQVLKKFNIRFDTGFFIPTSTAVSTYQNGSGSITSGLNGLAPALNTAVTINFKF